jgi:hypothetical protein
MHALVTMGGQHQGVMNVPECWNPSFNMSPSAVCAAMQSVLGFGAYLPWIRDHIVQAQYFKARCAYCPVLAPSLPSQLPCKRADQVIQMLLSTALS